MSTLAQNVIDEHERGSDMAKEIASTIDDTVNYVSAPTREIFYDARVAGAFALGVTVGAAISIISRLVG